VYRSSLSRRQVCCEVDQDSKRHVREFVDGKDIPEVLVHRERLELFEGSVQIGRSTLGVVANSRSLSLMQVSTEVIEGES